LGLLDRVKKLHDEGHGLEEIRGILLQENPDKAKDIPSFMGIQRALELHEKQQIQEQVHQGIDPLNEFTKEFRHEVTKIIRRNEKILDECEKALEDAKASGIMSDRLKAIDVTIKGFANERKNWESLQQFGIPRIEAIDKEAFRQKEAAKILLIKWTTRVEEKVCPLCKEKVIPEIIHLVESEGE